MNKKFLLILVLGIAALSLAACNSTQDVQANATPTSAATLIVEGKLLPVKALDESFSVSGRVDKVLVQDGQQVQTGDVLVQLENTAAAQLALAQAQQDELEAQQALDEIQSSTAASAQAELALTQAQSAYNTALANYNNRNNTQGTTDMIAATRARLTLLDNQIGDLEDTYKAQGELSDSDPKKAQTLQALSQARIDRDNIKKLLDYYQQNPDALDVQTLKAKLDLAKADLEDAKRVFERMQNGIDPNQLAAAQARLKTAQAAVVNAQASLNALQLTAGMSGTVIDTNVIPGQQVTAGQTLLSLADTSIWIVETDNLTETDVVNIKEGQNVEVILDALPNVALKGRVTHINNRFEEVRGDVTYTVTITLTETDPRMRWGMTASVRFLQ
ncbi:MAG: HlyD family efflux transporter periplasmic adaptor subunit [Anaerolineaceae bacterium]|nr:HlyD family efflux transporter periplasmic adaptor subunit [Anaerolineaceae bacterium]